MNSFITTRFSHYQELMILSPIITNFVVLKQNITAHDGRIRVKAMLSNRGLLEFAEYLAVDEDLQILTHTYTFHWQDEQQKLMRRWDNVNHFPHLPHAPHHIHVDESTVIGNPQVPTLEEVLLEIEHKLDDVI